MTELAHCPRCGQPLPAHAPAGLCPPCLIRAGLESELQPQSSSAATIPSPATARFEPLSVESLAGKFPQLEILELLGKGGMGAVYKARQRGLDRLVAVKVLPPEIGHDPAFAERFTREARALARLSHNHIVSVFDFGQSDGLFYIVMEYVDGVNLRQTIQTGKLTPAEALAIVPQICEALQFAHDEGIVHRDIKPENILIDKRGRVKIADFGLAKLLGQDAGDHLLTATHQIMGTLRYMAPEQMQGSREVDHRADIYSLGVIFYELLTGDLPMGKFAPPSKRVQIDVRLDEIVLRALEQQPEQRYQHASDIKTDVDAISRTPKGLVGTLGQARDEWWAARGVAAPKAASDGLVFRRLSVFNVLFWLVWSVLIAALQWGYLSDAKWYFQKELPHTYLSGAWTWVSLMFAFFFGYWWYLLAKSPETPRSLPDAWRTVQTPDRRAIGLWVPGAAFLAVWIGAIVLTMSFYDDDVQSTTLSALIIAAPLMVAGSCWWAYRERIAELCREQGLTAKSRLANAGGSREPSKARWQLGFSTVLVATTSGLFLISLSGIACTFFPWGEIYNPSFLKFYSVAGVRWWQGMFSGGLFGAVVLLLITTVLLKPIPIWRPLLTILAGIGVVVAVSSYLLEMSNGSLAVQPLLNAASWEIRIEGQQVTTINEARVAASARIGPYMTLTLAASLLLLAAIELGAILKLRSSENSEVEKPVARPVSSPQHQAIPEGKISYEEIDTNAAKYLVVCGGLMLLLGVLGGTMGVIGVGVAGIVWSAQPTAVPHVTNMLGFVGMIVLGSLVGDGGWCIISRRNYHRALLASLLSLLLGLLMFGVQQNVLTILGFVPGVVALYFLLQPEIKAAFPARRVAGGMSQESPGGNSPPTPWDGTQTPTQPLVRPKLVPVIALFNLVGAIVLMLACWMESPAEFARPVPRLWQVWEQVDMVLAFAMAAGMFAASIGLFLWKQWARKLTLGVCIFGLASLVFDAPYLARFAILDLYTDIEQTVIAEGVEGDVRDFVTLATFLLVFGGSIAFGLACLIGQVVYFTRPRVVAAFESQREKYGRFIEWLFTPAGAVVGVVSVFGPLALLLGIAALFQGTGNEQKVDSSVASPNATPTRTGERTIDDGKIATLFDAAANGQVDRVKQLLDAGSSVNAKDADGQTPLLKAVAGGHKSLALTLILLGADLTEQDQRGRSALMIAAEKRDAIFLSRLRELSQLSYERDADKRKERLRAFPGIEQSLLAGRDVDLVFFSPYDAERLKDPNGENALMKAARSGDWECFQLLATQTDTLLAQDKLGRTTLMHAILSDQARQSRWKEQFEWLTKPPYFGVAGVNNIYVGPMLIFELERSLSVLDNDGKSVVRLAEEHQQPEVARILRRHLEMVITNQTAEVQKGSESAAQHLRLRALAWRALGEIEKSEADFKKALPE